MSQATKRKHVTKEVTEDFCLPDVNHQVVRVLSSKGNNLHEVETAESLTYLVSMPTKFRKNIWIKRGDYVMIQPIDEGDKVKAEITHILYKPQIAYIQQQGLWPAAFASGIKTASDAIIPDDMLPPSNDEDTDASADDSASETEGGNNTQTYFNPNRQQPPGGVAFREDSDDDDEGQEVEEELGDVESRCTAAAGCIVDW